MSNLKLMLQTFKIDLLSSKTNNSRIIMTFQATNTIQVGGIIQILDGQIISERKKKGQGPRSGQQAKEVPPCHISRSFVSAGLRHEGQVAAICDEDSLRRSNLVQPCPPSFQLGNWRVEERPEVYTTSIM